MLQATQNVEHTYVMDLYDTMEQGCRMATSFKQEEHNSYIASLTSSTIHTYGGVSKYKQGRFP